MTKAITIHQPYASAIMQLGKDVENRSWTTSYRGKLYIHAGKARPKSEHNLFVSQINGRLPKGFLNFDLGAVLGYCTLSDIVKDSSSKWAVLGQYHWLLTDVVKFETPVHFKGRQKLWDIYLTPDERLDHVSDIIEKIPFVDSDEIYILAANNDLSLQVVKQKWRELNNAA